MAATRMVADSTARAIRGLRRGLRLPRRQSAPIAATGWACKSRLFTSDPLPTFALSRTERCLVNSKSALVQESSVHGARGGEQRMSGEVLPYRDPCGPARH